MITKINEVTVKIVTPKTITIILSEEEAGLLASITGKVSCPCPSFNNDFHNTPYNFVGDDAYENKYKRKFRGRLETVYEKY